MEFKNFIQFFLDCKNTSNFRYLINVFPRTACASAMGQFDFHIVHKETSKLYIAKLALSCIIEENSRTHQNFQILSSFFNVMHEMVK